jgi:hypothetical protein
MSKPVGGNEVVNVARHGEAVHVQIWQREAPERLLAA